MRVLVVGAGIGGLVTALSLHGVGITDVSVVEAVPEILPLGVGINLLPHAVRELTELGLGEALAELGVATADLTYVDRFGSTIWSEPRGLAAGYRWPQYSIQRGRLQQLLLDETIRRLGPETVHTGCRVRSAETTRGVARLTWTEREREVHDSADVIIAADGIKSAIRTQWLPDEGPPQWNGQVLWRAMCQVSSFLTGRSMIMAGDREQKFVAYPIESPRPDGTQMVNWIAEKSVTSAEPSRQDWNRRVDKGVFAGAFSQWSFGWLDVPTVIAAADTVYEYPMVDRPALDSWVRGRVALLGDAAHPTYPIGSNGSSQAIIDARVLAYALVTRPIDDALRFYEQERLPKTRELQRVNREMGPERVMQMVRDRAPAGFANIHDVITQAELEEVATSYKRVAGFDPTDLNHRASWTADVQAEP